MPSLQVRSVFLQTDNPDRALMELVISPGDGENSALQWERAPFLPVPGIPYPVEREEGEWRAGFPSFPGMASFCPFAVQPPQEQPDDGDRFPSIPGLEFSDWKEPSPNRDRTPGTMGTLDSVNVSSAISGSYIIEASGLIESGEEPVELTPRYRDNLAHPAWELREDGAGDDAAWFT